MIIIKIPYTEDVYFYSNISISKRNVLGLHNHKIVTSLTQRTGTPREIPYLSHVLTPPLSGVENVGRI